MSSVEQLTKTLDDIKKNSVSKSEVEDLVNNIKDGIKDEKEKFTRDEFIKHLQECNDKDCSIHMAAKDMQKKGLLKGMALSEKLHSVKSN